MADRSPSSGEVVTGVEPLVLTLDGTAVTGIPAFYDEINRVFMAGEDWQLGQSLDALDDMLYGGYGVLAGHATATIVWNDVAHSREALGVEATRTWLQGKLDAGGTFNRSLIADQLVALEAGEGQTYFEIVMSIFAAHPQWVLLER